MLDQGNNDSNEASGSSPIYEGTPLEQYLAEVAPEEVEWHKDAMHHELGWLGQGGYGVGVDNSKEQSPGANYGSSVVHPDNDCDSDSNPDGNKVRRRVDGRTAVAQSCQSSHETETSTADDASPPPL